MMVPLLGGNEGLRRRAKSFAVDDHADDTAPSEVIATQSSIVVMGLTDSL